MKILKSFKLKSFKYILQINLNVHNKLYCQSLVKSMKTVNGNGYILLTKK